MNYHNVMIDVETMALVPRAAIVSVAAVPFSFDPPQLAPPVSCFYERVYWRRPGSDQDYRTIDHATEAWWREQGDAARRELDMPERVSLRGVLAKLRLFLEKHPFVWSKPASFDLALLADAYATAFHPDRQHDGFVAGDWHDQCPWGRHDRRDVRSAIVTTQLLGAGDGWLELLDRTEGRKGLHHALGDAVHQTSILLDCVRHARGTKSRLST